MITFPNAKINLGLNIVSRRPDGYHNIETVFYPIPLTDSLEIVPATGSETTMTCYGNKVDCPLDKNLVMKAYELMRAHYEVPAVDIYLYKRIPDGAGLGGGSSDAAHAMMMLNEMFALGASDRELAARAVALGADCPFFIYNRPVLAMGIGNVFTPVEVSLKGKTLLLVKPDVSVSTKEAYAQVTATPSPQPIPEILSQPVGSWAGALKNDFEKSVFAQFPALATIKSEMEQGGAQYCCMSGSGSSIFGIFDSDKLAKRLASQWTGWRHFVMRL